MENIVMNHVEIRIQQVKESLITNPLTCAARIYKILHSSLQSSIARENRTKKTTATIFKNN